MKKTIGVGDTMDTVARVFYAIAKDNLHTRKEIAAALGVSIVTVGKSVEELISADVIFPLGKSSSDVGRRSDFLEVAPSAKVLLIDLCGTDLAYSLAPLSEASANVRRVPYIDSLDFADNLVLLINDIKKRLDDIPLKIMVALPGESDDGRIKNAYVGDYSGFDVSEMLSKRGLCPDLLVSCASAIEASDEFSAGDAFVSVSDSAWGTFGRGKVERWGNATVDTRGELTFEDALRCSTDEDKIAEYSLRFLRAIDGVISPERILFSCDRLSKKALLELNARLPKLVSVSADEMIFDGLMELAMAEILKEISNKR